MDQNQVLRVSDLVLLQIEGKSVLDEYGRILTWHARVVDGEVEATITYRDPSLRERLRWALRPRRMSLWEG